MLGLVGWFVGFLPISYGWVSLVVLCLWLLFVGFFYTVMFDANNLIFTVLS